MALTFYRKSGGSCHCGCVSCSQLEFKQIRATKSRMVGYAPLDGSEPTQYYLKSTTSHSHAYPCGTSRGNYYCPPINKCDALCDSEGCCNYEPVTVEHQYDRFRGCEKLLSECELASPITSGCTEPVVTETTQTITCDATGTVAECAGTTCTISTTLDTPYTQTILEQDIDDMRASVTWGDFAAPNCGGDVIGLEEGTFIFPHYAQTSFDAHYYTDDDVTYIDKAWLQITNPTTAAVTVQKTFYPQSGGAPTVTDLVIEAGQSVEIDPPATPGYILLSEIPCVHYVGLEKLCQTRAKHSSYENFPTLCRFCSYAADSKGNRQLYSKETHVSSGTLQANVNRDTGWQLVYPDDPEFSDYLYRNTTTLTNNVTMSIEHTKTCTPEALQTHCVQNGSASVAQTETSEENSSGNYSLYSTARDESSSYSKDADDDCGNAISDITITLTEANESGVYDTSSCSGLEDCGSFTWWETGVYTIEVEVTSNPCIGETAGVSWYGGDYSPGPGYQFQWRASGSRTVSLESISGTEKVTKATYVDMDILGPYFYGTEVVGTLKISEPIFHTFTLSEPIVDPDKDTSGSEEWGSESLCASLCASYTRNDSPTSPSDTAYQKTDTKYRLQLGSLNHISPETYESLEIKVRWYTLVFYDDCAVPIEKTLTEQTKVVTRSGAPGSYTWASVPDITGELDAATYTSKQSGSVCIRYATAILIAANKPIEP